MGSMLKKLNKSAKAHSARNAPLNDRVDELRRLVQESKQLSTVDDHFNKLLVADSAFMSAGKFSDNPRLVSVVRVAAKAIQPDTRVADARVMHLVDHHLWHGVVMFASGAAAQVLYFDDVNRGMCTLGRGMDGKVHYFRFSIPEGMVEPIDPDSAELVGMSCRSEDPGQA